MNKLNPKKAAENPLAAALLGSVMVKHGRQDNSRLLQEGGEELLRIAEANQGKMPRLKPNSKLARAIKALKKAMAPAKGVPMEDSRANLKAGVASQTSAHKE